MAAGRYRKSFISSNAGAGAGDLGRPLWAAWLAAAAISAVLSPLVFLEPWRLVEARLFDLMSTIDPPRPEEAGAIVVAVDEPSSRRSDGSGRGRATCTHA